MDVFSDWRSWLIRKYNTTWDKVSADITKLFNSELVYNKQFLKTKVKSHGDEVIDFYDKKIPWVDSNHRFSFQERWQLLSAKVFKRV